MILDTIAQGADQTVLSVRIEAENPRIRPAEDWTARLSLKDESGRIYPLTDENLLGNQDELAHALRTMAFEGGERLTLRLDQLLLAEALPPDSSAPDFRFDPGDRPQIGQTWQLDQSLSSERFTINIIGAELEQGPDGQVRLVFSVEGQPGLESVLFGCSAPICVGGEGGGLSGGPIEPAVLLKGLPTGPINIRLDTVYYRAAGPWEIHWQPPTLPEEISTQPTNTPAPTPTRVPSPTAASEDPILAEVMTLFDRGLSPFQTSSGWVHVVVENQTGGDLGQDSRGGSIPSHSIMENWYELDPGGFITRMITLMKTPDGQVVQQAVTVGRYSYNFTLDTFLEFDDKPRKINFANEAITFLQQMIANDLPLYRQETPCEGRACLLVTPFEPGVQPSRETYDRIYEAAGLPRQVWIDLETGWPILQERFQMDTGGVVQPWDSNRLLTLERASLPPLRLLHLFDQVAFPTSEPQSRPTPTATFQAPLAVEVQALLQKGFDAIYSQEGWVHVAWEDISPEDTEEYHSGKVGPAHSFGESWMYVEADGTISREVWLEKTVDGTVWRKIARAGKTQVDFFAGTAVEDEELLHKTQPDSLPLTIEAAERNDGQALREEVDLDGRPSWLIILAYTFDPAMEITPLPKPVIGAENRT